MARNRKPLMSLGQILQKTLKHIEISKIKTPGGAVRKSTAFDKVKEYSIFVIWESAVGKNVASHTRPKHFDQGLLIVDVDSSAWINELKFMKKTIIANVNEKLGVKKVKDIVFKAK